MLQRAAVLIGVRKTGGLPVLQAVQDGITRMKQWAASQPGMLDAKGTLRVSVVTDDKDPVTAGQIQTEINRFVADPTIEQLLVYFAGHGANVRYNEYWLLTGAPNNANEAINVEGSIPLARQCGVPHIVLISDACRTAAASIQSQAVQGSLAFPNTGPRPKPGFVDIFYATLVGKPSLEVNDPDAPAQFAAVYTVGLVDGLNGQAEVDEEPDGTRVVRPRPLRDYVEDAVPDLLVSRKVKLSVSQSPDAIITSDPDAWLSQLVSASPAPPPPLAAGGGGGVRPRQPSPAPAPQAAPGSRKPKKGPRSTGATRGTPKESLSSSSQRALRDVLNADIDSAHPISKSVRPRGPRWRDAVDFVLGPFNKVFETAMERTEEPSAGHFESKCGFKVRGSAVEDAVSPAEGVDLSDCRDGLVRVWDVRPPATNTLLVFPDGRGALLPAIPEFIAVVNYQEGELASVWYEPSDNSQRWDMFRSGLSKLSGLRQVVAAASRLGVFRPDTVEDRDDFVDRLRAVKWLDPAMAIYAAYALHALQDQATIEEMERDLHMGLGLSLFDVAMLGHRPGRTPEPLANDVFPSVPLLSQGWALVDAYGIRLPERLSPSRLQRHVTNSLWTLFDEEGVAMVRSAIKAKEVR